MLDVKDPQVLEMFCMFPDLVDQLALVLFAFLVSLRESDDAVAARAGLTSW